MKIAVYAGSFDPLHIGHLAVMKCLSEEGTFDRVYLVVSPQSPFKNTDTDTAWARFRAAQEAVTRHEGLKVTVEDIELGMKPPYYTIRTLDALHSREPDNEFTLVMGGDQLAHLRGWREWQRILLEYGIAVYPRSGYDCETLRQEIMYEDSRYKITILDAPLVDISSTEIREAGGKDVDKFLM